MDNKNINDEHMNDKCIEGGNKDSKSYLKRCGGGSSNA
jgi:hypothetical protein